MRFPVLAAALLLAATQPAFADCKADLAAIFAAQTSTPYSVEMTSSANGTTTKSVARVVFPDSFHITTEGMEMVMVKKKAWMKAGGQWQAMPGEAAALMSEMISSGINKGIDAVKDVQCLGSQSYEGEDFVAYSFTSSGEAMGIASTADVMLYARGGMAAWLVVTGEAMGTKSTTVQKITPDPGITIKPPM